MLRSLRTQYLLGSGIIFVVMIGLLLWNAHRLLSEANEAHFAAEQSAYAPLLVAAIGPLLASRDYASLNDVVRENAAGHRLAFVEVVDSRGLRAAAAGDFEMPGLRVNAVDVMLAGQRLGWVRYGMPIDTLIAAQRKLLRDGLAVGAGLLVAGLVLLALGSNWISAGFTRLSLASRRIGAGDYSVALPRSPVGEIDEVSQAINQMAAAVRSQIAELQEREQSLRHIFDTASEGLIILDRNRHVLDCNESLLRMYGTTRGELCASDAAVQGLQVLWPDGSEVKLHERATTVAIRTGQAQRDAVRQVVRRDGSVVWISANATPLFRANASEPHAVLASITDISRHVLAEQDLRNLNEALEERVLERTAQLQRATEVAEQASRAKSEFLSRMSHELRTPLNAVIGFAQLLVMARPALNERDLRQVQQIEAAGWHLLGLINEVLDLSRIESGAMSTSPEPVELAALVAGTLPMVQSLAIKHGVVLTAAPAAPDAWVLADRTRLKQVLANLLSNAIKYNRKDGRVDITIGPARQGRRVIAVSDTGRGFTAEQLQQLYQPFTRFEQTGETIEGTGIGLVITKRLVELMGGHLRVESAQGTGSTFSVDLPACDTPALAQATPTSATTAATTAASKQASEAIHRLLYIEDNPSNVDLLRQVLELRPRSELRVAVDGKSGLAMARTERFDLALIDIDLPDIDGVEVCKRLRGQPATAALPLIALSANAMERDVRRALQAGFDLYHTKPLDVPRLLAEIDGLLRAPRTSDG